MRPGLRPAATVLAAGLALAACDRGSQPPGMDANNLSDEDRGARAGRFRPAAADSADANDDTPADNAAISNESMQ